MENIKQVDKYIVFLNQCIGKGSYGNVYKSKVNKKDKTVLAVKIIDKGKLGKD